MDLLSSINNSAIGSLYAVSAAKDVNGNDITGTYLTAVPAGYATTADLTSKLDSTAFSTVSGSFLTAVPEGYATTGDLAGKLDTTAQVVTSITTGKLVSTGVSAINSTPILSTGVYKVGSIQIGSGDPGMYLTGQHGTAYYKANELIINRTGYGEQIKFNLGSAGSQIIGSAAGNRGAFIDMSNGSHTAFVGVLSGEDAAIVLDGVSATPNSITSWNGVVSTVSDNSASWAGGSVPEGVLVESGLEFDSENHISGYSGSAFSDSRAGTDLYVQYPLYTGTTGTSAYIGWNNETVLWSGIIDSNTTTATLSENISDFNRVKILCKLNTTTNDAPEYFEFKVDGTHTQYSMLGGVAASNANCYIGHASVSIIDTTVSYTAGNQMQFGQAPTNNKNATIYEIIGINRTAGGN